MAKIENLQELSNEILNKVDIAFINTKEAHPAMHSSVEYDEEGNELVVREYSFKSNDNEQVHYTVSVKSNGIIDVHVHDNGTAESASVTPFLYEIISTDERYKDFTKVIHYIGDNSVQYAKELSE